MVEAVNDSEFQAKVLNADTPVLVDFWAAWCGPCKAVAPILDELATEHQGKVAFFKLNIDENAETTTKYKIRGVPTLILFNKGEVVDQVVGAVPKTNLEELLGRAAG